MAAGSRRCRSARPSPETLRLMRQTVAPELAEVYPQFAARVFGLQAAPAPSA
jgi:hypothetical protein